MQRRTAVAAASAISMSLLSGVVFVGAHLGALGFGSAAVAPTARTSPAAVTVPAPAANQNQPTTTANVADPHVTAREHDDTGRPSARATTNPTVRSNARSGAHDD